MPQDQPNHRLSEPRLVVWQKLYEQILHSDRAAVDIGMFALKVVTTINAGALIALLAAVSSLEGAPGAEQFFVGLVLAVAAVILAYFYQSLVTAVHWNTFHSEFPQPGTPPPYRWARRPAAVFIVTIIILVIVSYVLFAWGTWSIVCSVR